MKSHLIFSTLTLLAVLLAGCQSTYYAAMESIGTHKREILVDRVKAGKDAQEEAKEQFQSALEKFTELTQFDGGSLQLTYDKLNRELKRSEDRADEVSERIDAIQDVSKDLFREWERELEDYQNQDYRRTSEAQLEETRVKYDELITAMQRAEASIEPVLVTFRDQVLFLKHNLNAQAIASLDTQSAMLKTDIQALIAEMETSIDEADRFIESMDQS